MEENQAVLQEVSFTSGTANSGGVFHHGQLNYCKSSSC